jgi:ABC-2 type transport system permease protein
LRIALAIAGKDIIDALKNKTTLSNIVMLFLIMAAYKWMPSLYKESDNFLVLLDEGNSQLVTMLEESTTFNPLLTTSTEAFEGKLDDADVLDVGLVIPADFDHRLEAGEQPVLRGYVMWPRRAAVDELRLEYEHRLAELLGQPVSIDVAEPIHFQPDSLGSTVMVAVTLVIVIFFAGTFTVPHLILDEKQTKTMDVLLVSPAGSSHVVAGKALAGAFYCLTSAAVAVLINWTSVMNWGLVIIGILCSTLFAVGLGLLLGIMLDNRQQMMIWAFVPANILLIPVFLNAMEPILPQAVASVLPWIPTVAQAIVFRYACSSGAPLGQTMLHLGVSLVGGLALLAAVVWKVRGLDRG